MYDIFDENAFESKNDENLNRKFDYNYQSIKHFYPEVSKLPEQEVAGIVQTMYEKDDDSFDDTPKRTMTYIKDREPFWKKYLQNIPKPSFSEAQRQNELRKQQYLDKGFYLTGNQWKDVAKTTQDGIISGTEGVIDGFTGGLYSYIDEYLNNGASQKRYDRIRHEAEQLGLEKRLDAVQDFNKFMGKTIASSLLVEPKLPNISRDTAEELIKNLIKAIK